MTFRPASWIHCIQGASLGPGVVPQLSKWLHLRLWCSWNIGRRKATKRKRLATEEAPCSALGLLEQRLHGRRQRRNKKRLVTAELAFSWQGPPPHFPAVSHGVESSPEEYLQLCSAHACFCICICVCMSVLFSTSRPLTLKQRTSCRYWHRP